MLSKLTFAALLLAANLTVDVSIKSETIRVFAMDLLHTGWALIIPLAALCVFIWGRKLTMLRLQFSAKGIWLPGILVLSDNLLAGLFTILLSHLAPSVITFSSPAMVMWFWFSVGSFVILLNIYCGELSAEGDD